MSLNNNHFQKNSNTSLIANLIRNNSNYSRAEIAKELGLYKSTVTNITQFLLDNNIVREKELKSLASKTSGRKAMSLELNSKFGLVVGLDLQPSHYRAVILDFSGKVLWEDRAELPSLSFEDVLLYVMKKALAIVDIIKLPLLAVSLGIPGIVDSDNGIIRHADVFNLYNFDVYNFGLEHFNVPLFVENDANCCAWYEIAENGNIKLGDFISIYSAYHTENIVYKDVDGIGIGLGLAINNKVYSGTTSSVGEFCSTSWSSEENGQTGLDPKLLLEATKREEPFRIWFKDICGSLIPVISVFNPEIIFLHGKPFSDEEKIRRFISEDCPQLLSLLTVKNCQLSFDNSDDVIVAKGAAIMYLQKLFNIPTLEEIAHRPFVDWDLATQQVNYHGSLIK